MITVDTLSAEWFVRPGDVVFDIGTFTGEMSALYLERGASAVYGFEPIERNRARIRASVSANPAFHLVPYALSDSSGPAEMIVPSRNDGASSLSKLFFERIKGDSADAGETIAVETRRLDDLDLPRANFWKLDVEGVELAVLKGADQTLQRKPPDIIQVEIFAFDTALYYETLTFLSARFNHVWAIGATADNKPVHYPVTPKTVAHRQFHEDISRGGTPHYYASHRKCRDCIRLADAEE